MPSLNRIERSCRERNRLPAAPAHLCAKRIVPPWLLRACSTSIPPHHRDAGVHMDMSDARFLWLLVVGSHFTSRTRLLDCSVTCVVFRYLAWELYPAVS